MHRATLRVVTFVNVAVFCVLLTAAFPLPVPRLRGAPLEARPVPDHKSPVQPGEGLAARLRDGSARVRVAAAREAGLARIQDVAPILRDMTRNDDDLPAVSAALALAQIGEGCGALIEVALEREDAIAVVSLAEVPGEPALLALRLFLRADSPRLRGAALRALAGRRASGMAEAVAAALRDPDEVLRSHALEAALDAGIDVPDRGAPFVHGSCAAEMLVLAIRARGGDDDAAARLVLAATQPGASGLRAAHLLVRAERAEGVRLWTQRLDELRADDVVDAIRVAAGPLNPALFAAVRRRLRDPDVRVRLVAANALAMAGEWSGALVLRRDGLVADDSAIRAESRAALAAQPAASN